ncbi:unnamed protein product, partial [Rotaria magnacalcarata]
MEFLYNDRANPDCLDGSDEKGRFACDEDPSMRCEDRCGSIGFFPVHRLGFPFHCGDGVPNFIG